MQVGSAKTNAVETEFDRFYAEEYRGRRARYGRDGELPAIDLTKPPVVFPPFIKVLARRPDKVMVEVEGQQYWIIYGDNPRWEKIQ